MTIVLTYTKEDGTQQQVKYEEEVAEIDLHINRITSIDLSPLVSCTSLQNLYLQGNKLQSINLTPLVACTSLQKLILGLNQLQSLDLTPLSACTNLQYLYLQGNQLPSLNLAPLSTCTSLQILYLQVSQLQSLDLTPLAACTSLQKLFLYENQLTSLDLIPLSTCTSLQILSLRSNNPLNLDLTPLSTCTNLQELALGRNQIQSSDALSSWLRQKYGVYKRPISTYPWSFLCKITEEFGADRRIQQDILYALGLKKYGFIDSDLSDLFLSLPAGTPIELAHEQARARLLEEIPRIVDAGGASTGLNVEELSTHHGELAKSMQRVIELREAEIQRVIIGVRDTEVDLRELWLTAYGYKILTALEMQLTTDLEGLEQIKKTFTELDFALKTGETSVKGAQMSDELKQAIWWIAENRGRQWNEIEGE